MALFTRSPKRSLLSLGLYAGATALVGFLGSTVTRPKQLWYRLLSKPPGQPPARVFGPVWTALYGLMTVSAYRVYRARPSLARSRALRLWWRELALNAAWSPLFFGAHRPRAALADLVGMTAVAARYTNVARKVDKAAAWTMAPYLGWLGFATYLNGAIVARNPVLARS
jgi:tryptophan-rich sensory protein